MKPRPVYNGPPPSCECHLPADFKKFREDERAWFEELLASPHVQSVLHIPEDEPIFVLRAQDALVQPTLSYWLDIAENARVNPEKLKAARADYDAMMLWQRRNATKVKIPD